MVAIEQTQSWLNNQIVLNQNILIIAVAKPGSTTKGGAALDHH